AAIELQNVVPIAGLQMSIRSSSNVILQEPYKAARTLSPTWTVASYKVSDTVINVVIISLQQASFSVGTGALIEFAFAETGQSTDYEIRLENVKVATPQAEHVDVEINNLQWSSSKPVADIPCALAPNYPNPFNPTTRISYLLKKPAHVTLSIYDITGREIERLVDQAQEPGHYTTLWNSETTARPLASGIYFARLTVDNVTTTQKMILTK
ncbi:MAG: T9SS type A sorting domain-containing protein, partial [Bacteroidetes bacterium]|nr:T9SS type A sorting domain-containing protein [Bacteroidota bacterium]